MKITGGKFRGRNLKVPKNAHIRPSTEKIREAIFSSLGEDIVDSNIADLFCGSGALGLEGLSRGAKTAVFIDSDSGAISTIRENIRTLSLESQARAMVMNVLHLRPAKFEQYKIIFADPPYKKRYAEFLLISLQKSRWHGILVLEHESEWSYSGAELKLLRRLDFGDSSVSFLFREEAADENSREIEKGSDNG
jgi:16S rRNA (guanine(966)-N(2))-methyltransferase RsmD